MVERHNRELNWLLLDRGADPTDALWYAKPDSDFAEDVKAWNAWKEKQGGDGWEAKQGGDRREAKEGGDRRKAKQGDNSKCCVQ